MNLFGWLKRSNMKREIIVNVEKLETRVAVMENGSIAASGNHSSLMESCGIYREIYQQQTGGDMDE